MNSKIWRKITTLSCSFIWNCFIMLRLYHFTWQQKGKKCCLQHEATISMLAPTGIRFFGMYFWKFSRHFLAFIFTHKFGIYQNLFFYGTHISAWKIPSLFAWDSNQHVITEIAWKIIYSLSLLNYHHISAQRFSPLRESREEMRVALRLLIKDFSARLLKDFYRSCQV